MASSRIVLAFFIAGCAAAACTSKEVAARRDTAALGDPGSLEGPRKADSARSAQGTARIAQMSRRTGAMLDSMQAHLRGMRGLSTGAMVRMLPMHRRMVANLLAQMTTDMYSMHMPADVAWTATMDSLQQDLIQLPELTKAELEQAMPAHRARLSRIITMHKEMIEKMAATSK